MCLFAYGQTGSGKTFTMQGDVHSVGLAGLIPRSLVSIFESSVDMRERGWDWCVEASFMEVYNETIRDLLRSSGDAAAGPSEEHRVLPHEDWGMIVTGMTRVEVASVEHASTLMARAAEQCTVAATEMNATSSRSHCIFSLYLKGINTLIGKQVHGTLHLVDLAGSERLDRSRSTGERLRETCSINRSLSSLADVFVAKAQGHQHVPFRNSKLTHLMEPCLSGQGKTVMLVNVQPGTMSSHETLCSLRFAKQVSQCTTGGKPRRNVKSLAVGARACPATASHGAKAGACRQASERPRVSAAQSPPQCKGPRPARRGATDPPAARRPSVSAHKAAPSERSSPPRGERSVTARRLSAPCHTGRDRALPKGTGSARLSI